MREVKDSGVEWIGKIPKDWNIEPLKSNFSFGKGLPITKANLTNCGYPVLSYGQIHSKKNNPVHILPELIRYVGNEFSDYKQSWANEGDILFADTSEDVSGIGNHSYVDLQDGIYAGYHTILARKLASIDSRYFSFLFQTDAWRYQLRQYATGIKVFSITKRMLSNANVLVPPLAIQQRIADYLDDKCSKIDAIIEKQEKIIEKLKGYRLAIILETVTKGINGSEDWKDSNVEWMGKIPSDWDIATIGRIATVVRGASPRPAGDPRYFNGNDVPWITVAEVTKDVGKYIFETESFLTKDGARLSRIVEAGTLLLSNSGATLGVPKITKITGCINDGSVAFYDLRIDKEYLLYVLASRTVELRKQMQGYGQPNLNTAIVKSIAVPIPPQDEQSKIVRFLDYKCESIDKQVVRREQLISKLTEYKKSLIYECVTGKKEVC